MILRMNPDHSAANAEPRGGSVIETAGPTASLPAVSPEPGAPARPAVDFSLNELFLSSPSSRAPLRIGILTDGDELPAYVRRILQDIQRCDFAHVVLCVRNGLPEAPKAVPRSALARIADRVTHPPQWDTVAFALYLRYLDSRHPPSPNPHDFADCADLLLEADFCTVTPLQSGFVDRLQPDDVELVRSKNLDVLFRFGFRILRGGILGAARHGVWSYHHGDNAHYRGGPAHLWELIERNPISGVVLQQLNESLDAGTILAKGLYATNVSLSMTANRFAPYWSSEHFVIRALHELHVTGRVRGLSDDPDSSTYLGNRPIYRKPSNIDVASWIVPSVAAKAARAVWRRVNARAPQPVWHIGIRRSDVPLYRAHSSDALSDFCWLDNPQDTYRADPFLLERDGITWLFYEEFDDALGRGTIGCARITPECELEDCRRILELPYHLSYPHVFEHDGEVFMVPESHESGRVDLFRAKRFPNEWVVETTLLAIRAVDSTVFLSDGRWWMLVSPRVVPGHAAITYVFSSPALHGPWTLASHDPVCYDVRRARGAGRVFRDGFDLWRPSQDCSESYGRALGFNRLTIENAAIRQTPAGTMSTAGSPGLLGVHSYNRIGAVEVVDGLIFPKAFSRRDRRLTYSVR